MQLLACATKHCAVPGEEALVLGGPHNSARASLQRRQPRGRAPGAPPVPRPHDQAAPLRIVHAVLEEEQRLRCAWLGAQHRVPVRTLRGRHTAVLAPLPASVAGGVHSRVRPPLPAATEPRRQDFATPHLRERCRVLHPGPPLLSCPLRVRRDNEGVFHNTRMLCVKRRDAIQHVQRRALRQYGRRYLPALGLPYRRDFHVQLLRPLDLCRGREV
mmetsp:Transcript_26639/g.68422  ORF Transcript_26639/g.68422 Transcript_26639/m.68422 type:complete len:215 (-) Transcript_26639:132-776(-)